MDLEKETPALPAPELDDLYLTPALKVRFARFWDAAKTSDSYLTYISQNVCKAGTPGFELIMNAEQAMVEAVGHKKRHSGGLYQRHPRMNSLMRDEFWGDNDPDHHATDLLHDNVEDDEASTIVTINRRFNDVVAEGVWWATKKKAPGFTKLENEQVHYAKLWNAPRWVICGRGYDKGHNLAELFGQKLERLRHQAEETNYFTIPLLIGRAGGHFVPELREMLGVIRERHPDFRI